MADQKSRGGQKKGYQTLSSLKRSKEQIPAARSSVLTRISNKTSGTTQTTHVGSRPTRSGENA